MSEDPKPSTISVNGEPMPVDGLELSVRGLLQHMGYPVGSVAVAVNLEFVPRSEYGELRLHVGDEVEILSPMQGG